jgi:hypothetical protein
VNLVSSHQFFRVLSNILPILFFFLFFFFFFNNNLYYLPCSCFMVYLLLRPFTYMLARLKYVLFYSSNCKPSFRTTFYIIQMILPLLNWKTSKCKIPLATRRKSIRKKKKKKERSFTPNESSCSAILQQQKWRHHLQLVKF